MLWSQKERGKPTTTTTELLRQSWEWRYQPMGTRRYIARDGTVVEPVTGELDERRIREIVTPQQLQPVELRKAHCSACPDTDSDSEGNCGGGYFLALAPEVCK
eukprot:jgi/Psemu1/16356/gm1.16356_g